MKRIPDGTRVELTGTAFVVKDRRPTFGHADPYRTVDTGGEYLCESVTGGWRFWATAAKVEAEKPRRPGGH